MSNVIQLLERALNDAGTGMSLDGERLVRATSESQLDILMGARKAVSPTTWFRILGRDWSGFDDIWAHRRALSRVLRCASRAQLNVMMDKDERAAWEGLPPMLTVYRGARARNRLGLSWTLDRSRAVWFATQTFYAIGQPGAPMLYTGRVAKQCAVIKTSYGEDEVIAPRVRIISGLAVSV